MERIDELLERYEAWERKREAISEGEELGEVEAREWEASDDEAVVLLRDFAAFLRQERELEHRRRRLREEALRGQRRRGRFASE